MMYLNTSVMLVCIYAYGVLLAFNPIRAVI